MPAEGPAPVPGIPVPLQAGVVRLTAPNPGVMTGPGTNSYLVGSTELAVIDPGPDDASHVDALVEAAGGRARWILVTHTHPDHAPAAAALARRTGAVRLGYASRDGFEADGLLVDGDRVPVPGVGLTVLHTPGHASNHLCFLAEVDGGAHRRLLFTGDHVMEGSTVVISPPDGDLDAYLASLERLRTRTPPPDALAPGHGRLITDPTGAIAALAAHRRARGARVEAALAAAGSATVDELVPVVYDDTDPERHPIARRSLWAHLRSLAAAGRARCGDVDDVDAVWQAVRDR